MKIDPSRPRLDTGGASHGAARDLVTSAPTPVTAEAIVEPGEPTAASPLHRVVGEASVRNISPRQMAELSLDLYVAGILSWEDYALLGFQPELHPAYDRTIGALTGETAQPDRPRDHLRVWQERLAFERRYHADRPQLIARAQRIVHVLEQIETPTDVAA